MINKTFWAITSYFNPGGFKSRLQNYKTFRKHLNIPLIAVSNGLLDTIETIGNKKIFRWKHNYPAVPYYIMVAISNYIHFQDIYYGDGYNFPLDYYVFKSHLEAAKKGVAKMEDIMDFFTDKFGKYPFANEKYAMTQLGFYGGIENQTNSIVNSMGTDRLRLIVHELAHQWFADMITCETWNHAWLNEGFASYAEALYAEHSEGTNDYKNYIYTYRCLGCVLSRCLFSIMAICPISITYFFIRLFSSKRASNSVSTTICLISAIF